MAQRSRAGKAPRKRLSRVCRRPVASNLLWSRRDVMETPASNRLGLAEPVSPTEGNKPSPSTCSARPVRNTSQRPGMGAAGGTCRPATRGRIDALVQQLAETARAHSGAALSVCALGGYGRRSLCLHSDIDLLILFEDAMSPSEERFVGALLQPLWDLGLTVGQHVREISRFRRARPRQRRVPARAARRPLHRRRRAPVPAPRRLGAAASPPTTAGSCSMRCCSWSTSGTRRSTTRSTSSSPTSRARRAGCATSPPRGTSGCSSRAAPTPSSTAPRASCRTPRSSSSGSARSCTSRASAT